MFQLNFRYCIHMEKEGQAGDFMIDLVDKNRAIAFKKKSATARMSKSEDYEGRVFLKPPSDLIHIRSSDEQKNVLVFKFAKRETAQDWHKALVLGTCRKWDLDNFEVRLNLNWKQNKLNQKLGMDEENKSDEDSDDPPEKLDDLPKELDDAQPAQRTRTFPRSFGKEKCKGQITTGLEHGADNSL